MNNNYYYASEESHKSFININIIKLCIVLAILSFAATLVSGAELVGVESASVTLTWSDSDDSYSIAPEIIGCKN